MNLQKRPLSLVLFSHTSDLDGAGRSLLDLVKGFLRNKLTCHVVVPYKGSLEAALKEAGSGVVIAPKRLSNKWYFVSYQRQNEFPYLSVQHIEVARSFSHEIASFSPDYIISQTIVSPWGAICAELLDIPHVLSAREYGVLDHDLIFDFKFHESMDAFYRTSDIVFCVTQDVKKELFGNDVHDKCTVIYSGIELKGDLLSGRGIDLEGYFPNSKGPIFCIPGTLQPGKGQIDLVNAVLTLLNESLPIRCLLIGHIADYDYFDKLNELINASGYADNFCYLSFVDEIYSVLKGVDCIVSSSKNEALGRTLIEASLLGKPIVYTNKGGSKEVFVDGVHGLSYEPGDYEQLARNISTIINKPDAAMKRVNAAKVLCEQKFTIEAYHQRALNAIDSSFLISTERRSNSKPVLDLLTDHGKSVFELFMWRPKIYWKDSGQNFSEERKLFVEPIGFGYAECMILIPSDLCTSIRVDPFDHAFVSVADFSVAAVDKDNRDFGAEEAKIATNSTAVLGKEWHFCDAAPQITIDFSRPVGPIRITFFIKRIVEDRQVEFFAQRSAQLAERDAQLAERDFELHNIKTSMTWQMTVMIRKILARLMPPGSFRFQIAQRFFLWARKIRNAIKLKRDLRLLRTSLFFDADWYLSRNSNAGNSDMDAYIHFLKDGWREGRNPSPFFDTKFYLDNNPDVKEMNMNPLIHFIRSGKKEGRNPTGKGQVLIHKTSRSSDKFDAKKIKKAFIYLRQGKILYILNYLKTLIKAQDQIYFRPSEINLADISSLFHPSSELPISDSFPPITIDIVIPVYNGMEFLPKLFDSIFKNTYLDFRLIIINDNSTDPQISIFLSSLIKKHSNVIFRSNQENLGFVKTVNFAASFVENHFVLLNTDVEVPQGWLKRLMRPIMENPNIASVTPFTNAGTICSFPTINKDNALFGGEDLETIDSVFRQIISERVIEIPTGIGFCMGINKAVWQEIGPLNERVFERGYGEENDWCMRAISHGYKNIVSTNLFVYHKHGGSFLSDEKKKLAEENMKKLIDIHPAYLSQVHDFIVADPLRPFRDFAKMILLTEVAERVVFIIDHAIGGGANGYRRRFIQNKLKKGYTVFLLTHNTEQLVLEFKVMNAEYEIIFNVQAVDDLLLLGKHIPKLDEIIYNNLVSYEQPLEILETLSFLKKQFSAKLTVLVHDYYMVCPSYTLLDYQGNYCDVPDLEYCQKCLSENLYAPWNITANLKTWRVEWGNFLAQADEVVCFSESSCETLGKAYNIPSKRMLIRPHKPLHNFEKTVEILAKEPLSVGIVGALNYAKGSQMVVDVARIFAKVDQSVCLTVIGSLDRKPLSNNVTVTGPYANEDLPNLLKKYDVNLCFFPSIWPETFSYVVGELMDLGMPICAFNLGAPAERLVDYTMGCVIPDVDAAIAVNAILEFYGKLKATS